jgi:hypothetical protein
LYAANGGELQDWRGELVFVLAERGKRLLVPDLLIARRDASCLSTSVIRNRPKNGLSIALGSETSALPATFQQK